ncbi:MAG: SIMPL domain-containing protein, partial [Gemmatimonadetes bacterium]|nr:SIMPL domain-containing protein [Gemmatimonadota bacterium]
DDRIETSGYTVYPEYRYDREVERAEARIIGYRAVNQVTATTRDLDSVGKLIDAGLAAGANRVAGIEFALANAAPHREQALRQAVEKARREASAIADALGVPLGPVLDARTESPPVPPILRAESREMAVAAAVPTPIEPGALTVRATVTLRFRIGAAR